jgi:hypothetical protein
MRMGGVSGGWYGTPTARTHSEIASIVSTPRARDLSCVDQRVARFGIAQDTDGQPSAGTCETLAGGACSAPINAYTRSNHA